MPDSKQQRGTRSVASVVVPVCVAALGMAGTMLALIGPTSAAMNATSEPQAVSKLLLVESLTVRMLDGYEVMENYAGRVVSRRSSSLGFERSGQLESVHVDTGDRVETGAVLAQLNTQRLEAKILELRAELERSQAQRQETEIRFQLARTTADRHRQMVAKKQVSPQIYDESVFEAKALSAQLAAADAQVKYVEATITVLQVDLDHSTLRAPFAGSILSRWADEGTAVGVGQRILRLIEDRELEVHVGVPADATVGLKVGRTYAIDIGKSTHDAELRTLLAEIDSSTRTVTAIFELESAPGSVRMGQLARLKMAAQTKARGFWLPISALAEGRRGLWSAYALDPDGPDPAVRKVSLRELQLLHSEEHRAFVRGTVRDGEVVVASGLHRLVPGQRVRMATPDENLPAPAASSSPAH